MEHLKAGRGEWFRQILHDWEPAQADAFNDQLGRFATSLEANDQIRSPTLPPGTSVTSSDDALPATVSKEQ